MFNAAQIENSLVTNVVLVDDLTILPNLVEIPDGSQAGIGWSYIDGEFIAPPPYIPSADDNKQTAIKWLKDTDWTSSSDVGNPQTANPYLENQTDFIAWRSQIRNIAVNPIAGNLDIWSQIPQEQWKAV